MRSKFLALLTACGTTGAFAVVPISVVTAQSAKASDARIRTINLPGDAVIPVLVRRGVVTQIVLAEDEVLVSEPATGTGADCKSEEDRWCVVAPVQGRDIYVKPRAGAVKNNMIAVTTRRRYVFEFSTVADGSSTQALMRLTIAAPPAATPATASAPASVRAAVPTLSPREIVENRMRAMPTVRNTEYSVAVGDASEDIVPSLVFDDGTKTYLSYPNNRPMPAIFEVFADGTEGTTNVSARGDTLILDRVVRRLRLRMGSSVVAIINEAFDPDGVGPTNGTTVPGVRRVLRTPAGATQGAAR